MRVNPNNTICRSNREEVRIIFGMVVFEYCSVLCVVQEFVTESSNLMVVEARDGCSLVEVQSTPMLA